MSEYGMFYRMYELQQNRAGQDRTDMNIKVIVIFIRVALRESFFEQSDFFKLTCWV